jgi:hypothetical protein
MARLKFVALSGFVLLSARASLSSRGQNAAFEVR